MMRLLPCIFLLIVLPFQTGQAANTLSGNPSPYLAMHAEDPVDWHPWGEAALARARAENKPLFISSGYFSCHWCHVMQRESYRDEAIAALLNRHFIPVKIDRELHPALDRHLIDFVRATRGQAGWPLNVFLTPEGYPFVGLTYARPEPFRALLQRVAKAWTERGAELNRIARDAAAADAPADAELVEAAPEPRLRALVELTLDQMASQGLRDQIGGGFFRYTVDPGWQVPHYEKMLYTQALLSRLYLQAGVLLKRPDYLEVARDTLDFTLQTMAGSDGGFIASLSAVDDAGVEGGGYLWSEEQLREALLPGELAYAGKRWRLQGALPTDGGFLPLQGAVSETEAVTAELEALVRGKLLAARAPRQHPGDAKQLAAWNGLMLSALVDGARILQDIRYRDAAAALAGYLAGKLWDGRELHRMRDKEGSAGEASLEDYAYVAAALHEWGGYGKSAQALELAGRIAQAAWERYFGPAGWRSSARTLIPGVAAETAVPDSQLPSPAAELIRLSRLIESQSLRQRADEALRMSYPVARRQRTGSLRRS
jgi:uncharacterized protein YyaL (SSP411 family)